jgi:hypothetical protein
MSKAEAMAEAYAEGEVDLDHDLPATGHSGKNRSKQEMVRFICPPCQLSSLCRLRFFPTCARTNFAYEEPYSSSSLQAEHKHEHKEGDTRRIMEIILNGEEKRKVEELKKTGGGSAEPTTGK